MPPLVDTRHRTSDINAELETARHNISALDREEAEQHATENEEYRRWIEKKAAKFRPALELYLNVYKRIRELDDTWRRQVFRKEEPFRQETEREVRYLYALWVAYSEMFEERAKYFSRQKCNFNAELDAINRNKREAVESLSGWEPPVPSSAPSFRPNQLSPESTARLREILPRTD